MFREKIAQGDKQHTAEGPDVALLVIRQPLAELWRNIVWRPDDSVGLLACIGHNLIENGQKGRCGFVSKLEGGERPCCVTVLNDHGEPLRCRNRQF